MTRPTPLPGQPGERSQAADEADPFRRSLQTGDAAPRESTDKAAEREHDALDNQREHYDRPPAHPERHVGDATSPDGPSDPYRQGP